MITKKNTLVATYALAIVDFTFSSIYLGGPFQYTIYALPLYILTVAFGGAYLYLYWKDYFTEGRFARREGDGA